MNLEELHRADTEWGGEPDQVLSFFSDEPDVFPPRLDVSYRFPIPRQQFYVTGLTTIGLATHEVAGIDRAELMFDYLGLPPDYQMLGQGLAQLVWEQIQKGEYFYPNMILRDIKLPFFEKMTTLFIMDWNYHIGWWNTSQPVKLLDVTPIHESEAQMLESLKLSMQRPLFVQGTRREKKTGELKNPHREPINLFIHAAQNIWEIIGRWYQKKTPRIYEQLGQGVSENEISQLEAQLAVKLPQDFAASLRTHNGGIEIHDYEYLTIKKIVSYWSMMNKLNESGAFADLPVDKSGEGVIQPTWWHPCWIPFALDSGGNLICIDLAPAKNGKMGQIIYKEKHEGPLPSGYDSFFEWLWAYKEGLYGGHFIVDEQGFIYPR